MSPGLLVVLILVATAAGIATGLYSRRMLGPAEETSAKGEGSKGKGNKPRPTLVQRARSGATKLALRWLRRKKR